MAEGEPWLFRFICHAGRKRRRMVSPSSLRNIRALLIEDNPADIYLIREALKRELVQFELEVVDNGEAASRLVDRDAY